MKIQVITEQQLLESIKLRIEAIKAFNEHRNDPRVRRIAAKAYGEGREMNYADLAAILSIFVTEKLDT